MNAAVPIRAFASIAIWSTLLSLSGGVAAQYAVSQLPQLATGGAPTNLVVMIDDSGSMAAAFVPDTYGSCAGTRAYASSTFNALAYNPKITYPAPSIIRNGVQVPLYAGPSFAPGQIPSLTAVYVDGLNPGTGTIDLTTGYQPTYTWSPGSTNQSYAPHPFADLTVIGVSSSGGGGGGFGGGGTCIISNSANAGNPNGNGNGGGGGGGGGGGNGNGNKVGAPAYYYVYSLTATPSCSSSVTDDNCYKYVRVGTKSGPNGNDETVNFANWYAFYRTRHLMIASAAAITMQDAALAQMRVSWRSLNTCKTMTQANYCDTGSGGWVDNQLRTFSGTQVDNFYTWLTDIPVGNATPLRTTMKDIGDFFSNTTLGGNSPYGINPNPLTGIAPNTEVACVHNYSLTLTDGQWNSDNPPFFGAADRTAVNLPDGTAYNPSTSAPMAIYSNDSNSDALADIAFHYWATNLRPDLPNSATALTPYYVKGSTDYWDPMNDPATWPHLVQMTIGVGMTTTMTATGRPWWGNTWGQCIPPSGTTYPPPPCQYLKDVGLNPGYYDLFNGGSTYPWPPIGGGGDGFGGDIGKAYDLWHAGVNSRGVAFSAESPADLFTALQASIARTKVTLAAQSAAAVSSTTLTSSTNLYLASFTSSDWHGTLSAYSFTGGTASTLPVLSTTPAWTTDAGGSNAPVFVAAASRAVATSSTGVPGPNNGIALSSLASNSAWTGFFASSTAATNTMNWILGDQSLEGTGAVRQRSTSVLGDIVDSAPVFSFQGNYGYSALPEGMGPSNDYASFVATKATSAGSIYSGKGMVYVGANDGMLHGFDAKTGKEVFAYVPHDIIPKLPALASTAYGHQFYVDQTPYVGDACIGTPPSCTWKTVLVGTTGAGGQGVFALDVTSPSAMETASNLASKALWDLDGYSATDTSGDPDLGYPIGQPVVARLNNGDWSAIFGNGYLSTNGCAVLFVVRLKDGQVTKIGTSGGSGTVCTSSNLNASNGLGPVTLSDPDGNFTTDFVYAGDLQGNLWKFDLSSVSSGSWAPAFGFNTPLFTASTGGGSCVTTYPAAMPTCQPITAPVALGPSLTTGMPGTMVYFGTGRLFAVGDIGSTTVQNFYGILDNGTPVTGGQGSLQQQTISPSGSFRTIAFTAVTSPKRGWYMNLPATGERVTIAPLVDAGRVWFATVIPSGDTCMGGGSSWLMAAPADSNFIGAPGAIVSGNTHYDGQQSSNGVIEGISMISDPPNQRDILLPCGTGGCSPLSTPNKYAKGRISWHEITK